MSAATRLGASKFADRWAVRVDLQLFVDPGRSDQSQHSISIFTPRAIQQLIWDNDDYDLSVHDGHDLNPEEVGNRIAVTLKSGRTPASNRVSFSMALNGAPLSSVDGVPYLAAVRGGGPHIFRSPGSSFFPNVWVFDQYHSQTDIMLHSEDHGGLTTVSVTAPPTSSGASGDKILDMDFYISVGESGRFSALMPSSNVPWPNTFVYTRVTLNVGDPTYTFTFDREAVAQAGAIELGYTIIDGGKAFGNLRMLDRRANYDIGYNATATYPFITNYARDDPNDAYHPQDYRYDLHFGNEADADLSAYPSTDRWLRNRVESMDATIVRAVRLTAGPVQKRAHFQ